MSVYVIAEFPFSEKGAQEFMEWTKSDDGYAVTKAWAGCCQTNEPKHQYPFDAYVYGVTKERHSVRAASRFSLNVLRFESDLCELNRL